MTCDEEQAVTEQAVLHALHMLAPREVREWLAQASTEERSFYEAERQTFADVVSLLALSAPEATPSQNVRQRLLAHVEQNPVVSACEPRAVVVRAYEGRWKQINEQAFVKKLYVDPTKNRVTSLIKLLPGGRLTPHRHRAVEECFIIEGDYHINGEAFGPGDYHCALPGTVDQELYSEGGTLFLLVAPQAYEPLESASH